jgi:hypothetical protein
VRFEQILKSKYCWFVMIGSLILSYFLIVREFTSFTSFWSILLSVFYIILFSISNSCLIFEIKSRVKNKMDTGKTSFISILGSILGFGAVQLCTVSGTCSINLITTLLFAVFPTSIGMIFVKNGIWILVIANLLLLYSIYKLECFRKGS